MCILIYLDWIVAIVGFIFISWTNCHFYLQSENVEQKKRKHLSILNEKKKILIENDWLGARYENKTYLTRAKFSLSHFITVFLAVIIGNFISTDSINASDFR